MNPSPENKFLFELDVVTDMNPNDFAWALLGIDGDIQMSSLGNL